MRIIVLVKLIMCNIETVLDGRLRPSPTTELVWGAHDEFVTINKLKSQCRLWGRKGGGGITTAK